jgi:hypothetical protein
MSLATMNWKRGLLRLWAVAAVLWVGVAFDKYNPIEQLYWPVEFTLYGQTVSYPGNTSVKELVKKVADAIENKGVKFTPMQRQAILSAKARMSLKELKEEFLKEDESGDPENAWISAYAIRNQESIRALPSGSVIDAVSSYDKDNTFEDRARIIIGDYQPNTIWLPLFLFAREASIPPLLLLALGYVGLWVGRGFKRSVADEK